MEGAKEHCDVQHWLLDGSHTDPELNLQVAASQQVELTPLPGSQSSPASTIPLPHICSDIVFRVGSGSRRQVVFVFPFELDCIKEPIEPRHSANHRQNMRNVCSHMFPRLHCEKAISPAFATGLIKNLAPALHVLLSNGQQGLVLLQLSAHLNCLVSKRVERKLIIYSHHE